MDCLYVLFNHCLEVRDGHVTYRASWSEGVVGYLQTNPRMFKQIIP